MKCDDAMSEAKRRKQAERKAKAKENLKLLKEAKLAKTTANKSTKEGLTKPIKGNKKNYRL